MDIIRDTRENDYYYTFRSYADVRVIDKKVDSGDYTLPGLENIVTIDRKHNSKEIHINFGSDSVRFNKELERLKLIKYSYFLCSFPYDHFDVFPEKSGIPKAAWPKLKIKGSYLKKRIKDIEEQYPNIKFIFTNGVYEAEEIAYNILKSIYEEHNGR